ncbi:SDR family oxidoreductase [Pseudoduganella chitinolytica]|uniref:SDR family oxidoreductase n=1 Tax=Pseudoduganella chitinolytica TaxID=34070 RepID=A0ABY8B881_9BURK|nr:SDR family oxidoreductase [Pseudoduganella chitinolytica]WEF32142.1 SDR family oxidoreductase [Pseudoduganella chitinolytica]
MKTVLITGCSSGFGLATARHFLEHDWNVVATMRQPLPDVLPASPRLRVLALDVTDADSIARVVAAAGPIDVLVNNAGQGALGALEGIAMDRVRTLFETNTLGTIALTQAVLPQFRSRRAGVIVNVTSAVTLLPLLAVYSASKAAVNAFTASLALEVAQFDVRCHLVLPGRSPETRFGENALSHMGDAIPPAYATLANDVFARRTPSDPVTHAADVARAVWRAATDPSAPMHIPAGADAVALAG